MSLPSARRSSRLARDAARVEDVAGAVEGGHDPDAAVAGAGRHAGEGAAHPPEAEEHHVGAALGRLAPPDLRQLERGVDPPRRLRRLPLVDHEGDVELGGALRDGDHVDAARGEGGEDARRDARRPRHPAPHHRDDRDAAAGADPVHEAGRELVAEGVLEGGRPRGRPRPRAG